MSDAGCADTNRGSRAPDIRAPDSSTRASRARSFQPSDWEGLEWQDYARCRQLDCNRFFPVGNTGEAIELTEDTKRFCEPCPVKPVCLEFALQTNQLSGIWGGQSEDDLRKLRKERAKARRLEAQAARRAASATTAT